MLERRVAIKVLTDEMIRAAPGRELFEREARATARVDHPHVVRILDFDVTEEGVPYLVLELLVGETLAQRLERGPLELHEARAVMMQACDALAFAHERGVLHRDVKTENLFLQRGRSGGIDVKVLDFGIALHKSAPLAHDPGVVGTPAYMSPEQLNGDDVDERCDLFSLAVCIYYALTKEYPYPGDSPNEAARSLARGTFTPMSSLRRDLPSTLDDWFSRGLAIERDARFDGAWAMLEAFERACQPSRNTAVAVDVSDARPRERSLPWGKAAALVAATALIALLRVTPSLHVAPVTRDAPRVVAALPSAEVATDTTASATSTQAPIQVVSIEMLPRVTAPAKKMARAAPKQPPPPPPPPAPPHDAGLDETPAVEPAPVEAAADFGY